MSQSIKRTLMLTLGMTLAVAAFGAQFGITTGPRPSNRPVNEPAKPKSIHGVVEDQQGKPVSGARVFLKDTKTNVTRTAVTDAEGSYSFANLPPEVTYDLTAEFKGVSEKKSVSGLLNRNDNIVDFELKMATGGADVVKIDGPAFKTYDGFELRASFDLPSAVPAPIPAVLLIHGYGENRAVFDGLKKQLLARGWAVMALDLRGHGVSLLKNGAPAPAVPAWRSSANSFPQDLEPALDWLRSHPRVNEAKIVVIGYDIGADLALIASGRFRQVRTVIAVQPSLAESLEMAGSAQDFRPRSALVIGGAGADQAQWKNLIATPSRFLDAAPAAGAAAAFANAKTLDAVFAWLKETF